MNRCVKCGEPILGEAIQRTVYRSTGLTHIKWCPPVLAIRYGEIDIPRAIFHTDQEVDGFDWSEVDYQDAFHANEGDWQS